MLFRKNTLLIAVIAALALGGRAFAIVQVATEVATTAVQTAQVASEVVTAAAANSAIAGNLAATLGMSSAALSLKLANQNTQAAFAKELAEQLQAGKADISKVRALVASNQVTNRATRLAGPIDPKTINSSALELLLVKAGNSALATKVAGVFRNLAIAGQLNAAVGQGTLTGIPAGADKAFCIDQLGPAELKNLATIFAGLDDSPEVLSAMSPAELLYIEAIQASAMGLGGSNTIELLSSQCGLTGLGTPAGSCSSTACMRLAATAGVVQ